MKKNVLAPILLILVLTPILAEIIMKAVFLTGWNNFFWLSGMIILFGILIFIFAHTEFWHYTRIEHPEDGKIYIVKNKKGDLIYGIWNEEKNTWKCSMIITKKTTLKEMAFYEYCDLFDIEKYIEIEKI